MADFETRMENRERQAQRDLKDLYARRQEDLQKQQVRLPVWNETAMKIEDYATGRKVPTQAAISELVRLGLESLNPANSGNGPQTPALSRVPPVGDGAQSPQIGITQRNRVLTENGPDMPAKCEQIDRLRAVLLRMQIHRLLED